MKRKFFEMLHKGKKTMLIPENEFNGEFSEKCPMREVAFSVRENNEMVRRIFCRHKDHALDWTMAACKYDLCPRIKQ